MYSCRYHALRRAFESIDWPFTLGVHEGKNEIAARIGYFKLGINLKTGTPTATQIRKSVEETHLTRSIAILSVC
jgi:hypothetical protein